MFPVSFIANGLRKEISLGLVPLLLRMNLE